MNENKLSYSDIQGLLDVARLSTNRHLQGSPVIQVSVWTDEELAEIKQLIKQELNKLK